MNNWENIAFLQCVCYLWIDQYFWSASLYYCIVCIGFESRLWYVLVSDTVFDKIFCCGVLVFELSFFRSHSILVLVLLVPFWCSICEDEKVGTALFLVLTKGHHIFFGVFYSINFISWLVVQYALLFWVYIICYTGEVE